MLTTSYLLKHVQTSILFAGNRVLKLVLRSRTAQVFILVFSILLVARFGYSPFVFFIMTNNTFVSNYMSIVQIFRTLFDVYLQKFVLSSLLFFFFWMSWIWVPLFVIFIRVRKRHLNRIIPQSGVLNRFLKGKNIVPGAFYVLSLVLILILYSYRYFAYPIFQGWDTVWYLESLRSFSSDFLGTLSSFNSILGFPLNGRPLFFLVLYSVNLVVGCQEVTLMVIPIIFAIIYAFATYEFVLAGTDDKLVAGLAMVLTSISYFTVRLSFDLCSNFLGLIIVLLFLTVFIKNMKNASKCNILLGGILFFALILVHAWTGAVFIIILVSFVFLQIVRKQKIFRRDLLFIVLTIFPSFVIGLIMIFVEPRLVTSSINYNFFSLPHTNWYYVGMMESPFLLIAAIFGLCVVFAKNTNFTNLIIAWVFVLSLAVFVTGYSESYRFYVLYPVGVLAAFGAYDMMRRMDGFLHKRFMWDRRGVLLYVIVPVLLCLLVFSSTLPEAFAGMYLQRPSSLAMMQIYWIYGVYGYNNNNIIVLLYEPPAEPLEGSLSSNIESFVRAYIGFNSIYFGNLTSLLSGAPDSFGRIFDLDNKLIILTSELYRLTPLELSLCKEVNPLGIYVVTSTNISATV